MITGSSDLDNVEEAFDVALKIDLIFKMLVNAKLRCSKCEGFEHYDYQCPSKPQHVRIVPSNDVNDSKVVENVYVPFKTASIVEDISVGSDTLIIEESHGYYEGTSEVDAIIDSDTPLDVDVHTHDIVSLRLNY